MMESDLRSSFIRISRSIKALLMMTCLAFMGHFQL